MDPAAAPVYGQPWVIRGKAVSIGSMVDLSGVSLDLVTKPDEARFRGLMQEHHFLGDAQPRGETMRYVAHCGGRWLALAMFSASALQCAARDAWIGWERGSQFSRLHLSHPLPGMLPDISGRTVAADPMLTQRKLATYLLERGGDHAFTVKSNQKTLLSGIGLTLNEVMASRGPDFVEPKPEHGRRERRSIWVSGAPSDHADFPDVGQVFAVHRETLGFRTGRRTDETAYLITSLTGDMAGTERHPAPTLRHRPDQGIQRQRRRDHAQTGPETQAGPRHAQADRQHTPANDVRLKTRQTRA